MQLLDLQNPADDLERELEKFRAKSAAQNTDMSAEISLMEAKFAATRARICSNRLPKS